MSDRLELRILGPLELLHLGKPIEVGGVKPRQLLATLALHYRRAVSVDQLVDVLWPKTPPRSAVANVHTYISTLRTYLGKERLLRQPPGYRLRLNQSELDVVCFDTCCQAGGLAELDTALTLWRGDPVEDLPQSPQWRTETNRLVEQWRSIRQARARLRMESGDVVGAIADLRNLVGEDPLREEAWLLLVTALQATGRRAEALSTYAHVRRFLVAELGIEPSEPLRRLHYSLLSQDAPDPMRRDTDPPISARLDSHADTVLRGLTSLCLGPTPEWVAAALLDREDARPVLRTLEHFRLVQRLGTDEIGQQRFGLSLMANLLNPPPQRVVDEVMLRRALGGYLGLAQRAAQALPTQIFGPGLQIAPRWSVPDAAELTKDPIAWFAVERQALLAAIDLSARLDRSDLAWEFTHALLPWFDFGGHCEEWDQTHRTALATCRRVGDLLGEAVTLRGLGQLHLYRDHYEAAEEAFSRSRLAYTRLGNIVGEASALAGLGAVYRIRSELDNAEDCYRQALTLYEAVGDRAAEAYAHGALGLIWLARQAPAEALRSLLLGLTIATELNDRHRIAHLIHRLGLVRVRLNELQAARDCFNTALDHFTALGDVHGEAYCLRDLASMEHGYPAIQRLTRALEIFERIGDRRGQEKAAQALGDLHRGAGNYRLGEAYLAEACRLRTTRGQAITAHPVRTRPSPLTSTQ